MDSFEIVGNLMGECLVYTDGNVITFFFLKELFSLPPPLQQKKETTA